MSPEPAVPSLQATCCNSQTRCPPSTPLGGLTWTDKAPVTRLLGECAGGGSPWEGLGAPYGEEWLIPEPRHSRLTNEAPFLRGQPGEQWPSLSLALVLGWEGIAFGTTKTKPFMYLGT